LFYAAALLVCIAGVYLTWNPPPDTVVRALVYAVQKGHVAFAFFTVVMFIGVFPQNSIVRRSLNSVRAELSIIASILIIGHFIPYLMNYITSISNVFSMRPSFISSFIIALILLVLLLMLASTSFYSVKRMMNATTWKGVQRFAYVFYCLIFVHLIGYLIIPVLGGSVGALVNVVIYGVILVVYVTARLARVRADARLTVSTPALRA
jgi:DMSO/TMAO reductase YedYZ heme-binding membrane subunit